MADQFPPLLRHRPMLVILGPTASGKSSLAMELARQRGAQILSVDSMQVYKTMDIGTAKPTLAERAEVTHHLIDCVRPDESFNVARFVELADEVIAGAHQHSTPLIATGGTPLYYKALFEGLFDAPASDAAIREKLAAQSNEQLHAELTKVDPAAAGRIHIPDTRRLIRALEVHALTGQPISALQTQWDSREPRHKALWIGLTWDRELLNRRINARVKEMISTGWVDEVAALMNAYPQLSKTAGEATGYAQLIAHLRGQMPLDDAIEQIKIATRQLARRQMKWLRRFPDVHWLDGNRPIEAIVVDAIKLWDEAAT